MTKLIEDVKTALPKLTWNVNGKTIKFAVNGIEKKVTDVATLLDASGCDITIGDLKEAILAEVHLAQKSDDFKGEISFIDLPLLESNLDALDKKYHGKPSKLWDEFLLQRLHKPEYVSIFKAWAYSVAVGQNNSRQEMWLYGNGRKKNLINFYPIPMAVKNCLQRIKI